MIDQPSLETELLMLRPLALDDAARLPRSKGILDYRSTNPAARQP